MARYIGSYQNDFGKVINNALLNVVIVTTGEDDLVASAGLDSVYLPLVFIGNTKLAADKSLKCGHLKTYRYALFFLDENTHLRVPVPFMPGTSNFKLFFEEAKVNKAIQTIGTRGERIRDDFVRFYAA